MGSGSALRYGRNDEFGSRSGFFSSLLVVQTRRLLPGKPAWRLLRFARNDIVSDCHCEEYSDEAISVKVRTGGNHLSGLYH
jgi:hypothetical protein